MIDDRLLHICVPLIRAMMPGSGISHQMVRSRPGAVECCISRNNLRNGLRGCASSSRRLSAAIRNCHRTSSYSWQRYPALRASVAALNNNQPSSPSLSLTSSHSASARSFRFLARSLFFSKNLLSLFATLDTRSSSASRA